MSKANTGDTVQRTKNGEELQESVPFELVKSFSGSSCTATWTSKQKAMGGQGTVTQEKLQHQFLYSALGISAFKGSSSSSSFPISTSARDSPIGSVSSPVGAASRFRVFVGPTSALLCHTRFPTADHCSHRWFLWISPSRPASLISPFILSFNFFT